MLKLLLLVILYSNPSRPFLIDFSSTKMLTINDTEAYFGYSILLQKGNPPLAIVGAPKRKHFSWTTGAVFACNLNNARCEEFDTSTRVRRIANRNGDFLGATLVGEEYTGGKFFSCAPRQIMSVPSGNYYLNGECYHFESSLNTKKRRVFQPLISQEQTSWDITSRLLYYNAAFGEAGFDIDYIKEHNALLLGAPGKSLWTGSVISANTNTYKTSIISPPKEFLGQYQYQGYAVAWGNFIKGSSTKWCVSGGPRGNELKGSVIFFNQDGGIRKESLSGEELGSYFGASLLVIHKNGGGDDILVGAPMYSGSSQDEGCVYYYRNKNDGAFEPPIKLSNRKTFSRFGTVMASVGDIDLDTFPDCAIAAPYEDDGVGAVYLYFGTNNGFSDDKYYRISPSSFFSNFPRAVIRGFGLGLSNGNDVDNNGHNDVVIGAYRTGQIFYFKTKQLLDFVVNVTSDKNILDTSSSSFLITYCISFDYRNKENKKVDVETSLTLISDRILNPLKVVLKTITLKPNIAHCFSEKVLLKENHLNIEPIVVSYGYRSTRSTNFTKGTLIIPVSYHCGTDNICETNLEIKTTTLNLREITLGVHNEVRVSVSINNLGESAYQTKLHLKVPPEVSLINLRECDFQNGSYICLVSPMLSGKIEKSFLLDVTNLKPDQKNLLVYFQVESIGKDVDPSNNQLSIKIPVVLQSNSHIDSRSQPENVVLNKSEDLKITHSFLVTNDGPSPLYLNLRIFIPKTEHNGSSFLEIESMEGTVNGITKSCNFEKSTSLITKQENYTKLISGGDFLECCSVISYPRAFLPKSNQYAIFTLKMIVRVGKAVNLLQDSNKLVLVTIAYYNNGTKDFNTSASTLIVSASSSIPLWIYIVAVIAGLILVMVLILTLYKLNFFKRTYKELLETQQQGENAEQCEGIPQDEDL